MPGMASSEAGSSLNQVIIPALEKIIKNGSWRKHSKLVHECKPVVDRLSSPDKSTPLVTSSSPGKQSVHDASSLPGVIHDGGPVEYSLADLEFVINPIINACSSGTLKIADPALDCIQKLIAQGYPRDELDNT